MDVLQIVRVVFIVCSVIQHSSADPTGDDVIHDVTMVTVEQHQQPMISIMKPIYMMMRTDATVELNYRIPCQEGQQQITVSASSMTEKVFRVDGNVTMVLTCAMEVNLITNTSGVSDSSMAKYSENESASRMFASGSLEVRLYGVLIGMGRLAIQIHDDQTATADTSDSDKVLASLSSTIATPSTEAGSTQMPMQQSVYVFPVAVMRHYGVIDVIFRWVFATMIIVITMGFGCKLDLGVVKECLKKPIAPGIGFFCQYLVMPLLAFTITKVVPLHNSSVAFGIFVAGTCPGGGVSNFYTLLFDGDVSLSITMTFLSSILSVGLMPLWLYTLGKTYVTDDFKFVIPYVNMAQVIAMMLVPLVLGILLKLKFPKVTLVVIKVLKPVTIFILISMVVVGIYANWYIFQLFRAVDILAGGALPYFGYIIGGTIATLLRQPKARIIAIALETGMQNVSIGLMLILFSFPPPIGDLAAVAPIASGFMTPIPPLLLTIVYLSYKKWCKKYDSVNTNDPEVQVKGDAKEMKELTRA